MLLIGFLMAPWQSLLLILLSILLLHALVYGVGFAGGSARPEGKDRLSQFFRFSIVGYGIALLVSLYVLWTFGRSDGGELVQLSMTVAVLAFPAAIGAAVARLVV
jgi:putative integral membrane protein (TIGR02587 family)